MADFGVTTAAGVSQLGLDLASNLKDLISKAKGTNKEVDNVAEDIRLTAVVLKHADEQLRADGSIYKAEAVNDFEDVTDDCRRAFRSLGGIFKPMQEHPTSLKRRKIKLSHTQMKKLEVARANLDRLKNSLLLLLNVARLTHKMRDSIDTEDDALVIQKLQLEKIARATIKAETKYEKLQDSFSDTSSVASSSSESTTETGSTDSEPLDVKDRSRMSTPEVIPRFPAFPPAEDTASNCTNSARLRRLHRRVSSIVSVLNSVESSLSLWKLLISPTEGAENDKSIKEITTSFDILEAQAQSLEFLVRSSHDKAIGLYVPPPFPTKSSLTFPPPQPFLPMDEFKPMKKDDIEPKPSLGYSWTFPAATDDGPIWKKKSRIHSASEESITLVDCVGRKFRFPFEKCKTYSSFNGLILEAFMFVDVIGKQVHEGRFDLTENSGAIILPSIWEAMITPGATITMHLWPLADEKTDEKKEVPKADDPLSDPFANFGRATMDILGEFPKDGPKLPKKKYKSPEKIIDVIPPPPPGFPDPFPPPPPAAMGDPFGGGDPFANLAGMGPSFPSYKSSKKDKKNKKNKSKKSPPLDAWFAGNTLDSSESWSKDRKRCGSDDVVSIAETEPELDIVNEALQRWTTIGPLSGPQLPEPLSSRASSASSGYEI